MTLHCHAGSFVRPLVKFAVLTVIACLVLVKCVHTLLRSFFMPRWAEPWRHTVVVVCVCE